jgi:hypothetical protein
MIIRIEHTLAMPYTALAKLILEYRLSVLGGWHPLGDLAPKPRSMLLGERVRSNRQVVVQ